MDCSKNTWKWVSILHLILLPLDCHLRRGCNYFLKFVICSPLYPSLLWTRKCIIDIPCNMYTYTWVSYIVILYSKFYFCYSFTIWFHHNFCCCLSPSSPVCPPQQLGGDKTWCSKVCLWNKKSSGGESGKHWNMVQNTGDVS